MSGEERHSGSEGGREGGGWKRERQDESEEGGGTRFNARTHRVNSKKHRLNSGTLVIVVIGVDSGPLSPVDDM